MPSSGLMPPSRGLFSALALTLLCLITIANGSCPEVVRQAIVAGQNEVDERLLSFSAVIHDSTGTCTATVINERWLLTAAHCSYAKGAKVRVGRRSRDGDADTYVSKFIPHPRFTKRALLHDIAVVEVAPPLEAGSFEPVALNMGSGGADVGVGIPEDTWTRTAGYGESKPGTSNTGMGVFRRVDLPIVSITKCAVALEKHNYRAPVAFNTSNYVCAGYDGPDSCGGDTCSGDSGGPLVVKQKSSGDYLQIGVTSAGAKCGTEKVPGVYTAVAGHAEWIAQSITGSINLVNAFESETTSSPPSVITSPAPSPSHNANVPTRTPVPSVSSVASSAAIATLDANPNANADANAVTPSPTTTPILSTTPSLTPKPSRSITRTPLVSPTHSVPNPTASSPALAPVSSPSPSPSSPSDSDSIDANSDINPMPSPLSETSSSSTSSKGVSGGDDSELDAVPSPDADVDAGADLTALGTARKRARASGQLGSSSTSSGTSSGTGTGNVRGAGQGGVVSAIVVAAVLGVLALVGAGFLAVRAMQRARIPPLQFEQTGDFDMSATPTPPFADVEAPPPGALAEADIPAPHPMDFDTPPSAESPIHHSPLPPPLPPPPPPAPMPPSSFS